MPDLIDSLQSAAACAGGEEPCPPGGWVTCGKVVAPGAVDNDTSVLHQFSRFDSAVLNSAPAGQPGYVEWTNSATGTVVRLSFPQWPSENSALGGSSSAPTFTIQASTPGGPFAWPFVYEVMNAGKPPPSPNGCEEVSEIVAFRVRDMDESRGRQTSIQLNEPSLVGGLYDVLGPNFTAARVGAGSGANHFAEILKPNFTGQIWTGTINNAGGDWMNFVPYEKYYIPVDVVTPCDGLTDPTVTSSNGNPYTVGDLIDA